MGFLGNINRFYIGMLDNIKLENMDERHRLMHFLWLISLGLFLSIPFMIYSIAQQDYQIVAVLSVFMTTLASSIWLAMKIDNHYILYNMANFVFLLMLTFFSFHETETISRILWCYIYPISSIFLFGNKTGVFWSVLMVIAVLIAATVTGETMGTYSADFIWRFAITYLSVMFIAIWLEHYKNRFQQEALMANQKLKKEIEERKILEGKLTKMAHTDPLTNLSNRRYFWQNGIKELERAKRYDIPISLAVLDIDHFKSVNDKYGHPAGDEVLRTLSRHCTYILRSTDLLARIGGEEFAFLLLHVNEEEAMIKFEQLRADIEKLSIKTPQGEIKVTVSIGVASLTKEIVSLDMLYKNADDTLYTIKNSSRNQVALYQGDNL